MSFEFKAGQSLRKGIRRIAKKQMDYALKQLDGRSKSRDESIHNARKAFKKIRAVLRLVRPAIGEEPYRAENACFRDASRPLSEVRDAKILVTTFDALLKHFNVKEHIDHQSFADTRTALKENLRTVRRRVLDEQEAFSVATAAIRQARERVGDWADIPNKWWVLGKGLECVYRSADDAFEAAVADATVEQLHEWRKHAKYLRYLLELLRPIWPQRLEEMAEEVDQMGELLGDNHDLAVLRQVLTEETVPINDSNNNTDVLVALIDRRRSELERDAVLLGERFFQDRPNEFSRRFKNYWKLWRSIEEGESRRLEPSSCL